MYTMYRCCNRKCREVFATPYIRHEDVGDFSTCPVCGEDFYDEVMECEVCGEWISVDDIYACKKNGIEHYMCGDCADELSEEEQNDLYWYA